MSLLRWVDFLWEKAEELLLAFGIIALSILLLINVFLRTFFSRSIVMAEEVGQIIILAITFLGLSYVARHGRHIRMSVLYDLAKDKYRRTLAILIPFVTSMTLFYLSHVAFRYMSAIKIAKRVTSSLQIPVQYITLVVAIGLFTAATQFLRIFFLNLRSKEKKALVGTYEQKN